MTFAYNEYGQEIACGIDVTECFDFCNEVEVIGEISYANNSKNEETEDEEQLSENTVDFKGETDQIDEQKVQLKKTKSNLIKRYTYSKTKAKQRVMTLLEKKKHILDMKSKSVIQESQRKMSSKGKASKKFPAKSSTKKQQDNRKDQLSTTPPRCTKISKTKQLLIKKTSAKTVRKNKKLTRKEEIKKKSQSTGRRVKHVYASIPQPKLKKEKDSDVDYKPPEKMKRNANLPQS